MAPSLVMCQTSFPLDEPFTYCSAPVFVSRLSSVRPPLGPACLKEALSTVDTFIGVRSFTGNGDNVLVELEREANGEQFFRQPGCSSFPHTLRTLAKDAPQLPLCAWESRDSGQGHCRALYVGATIKPAHLIEPQTYADIIPIC